jgi:phospholipid/cholesterol/gamma-HCH transport system ATP-binding protein
MSANLEEIPALEFQNVSIGFDELSVLRDVSFKLQHGEMICLTGASGSGKSVLLKLAMGLLRPDSGKIFVNGREIDNLYEEELLELRGNLMGMVFQEDALFSGLTVYDNTAFRLVEHDRSPEEVETAVDEVLAFVGLQDEKDKLPEELSGGMKRRLEIARALVGYPSIMLYDEPTSGLDPLTSFHILDLIIRARDVHHISSLVVTKRLDQIPYIAANKAVVESDGAVNIREATETECNTRVLMLDKGVIGFSGTIQEFEQSQLSSVTYLTHAENGTEFSDYYTPDPWSKERKPREETY